MSCAWTAERFYTQLEEPPTLADHTQRVCDFVARQAAEHRNVVLVTVRRES